MYRYLIGIDTGDYTGVAVWDIERKEFESIQTLKIHQAMRKVDIINSKGFKFKVFVEDARKRKWYGKNKNNPSVLQGVGSVKRDANIWEDFLTDLGIDFEMIHPIKGATKIDSKRFNLLTGWTGRTSEHARDSAMIVYNRKL